MELLGVALGGALGSLARYGVGLAAAAGLGAAFPYGTLLVNLVGSFLMALLVQASLQPGLLGPALRLALGTGLLGGFTTYSSFNQEALQLVQSGAWMQGLGYVGATLAGCLAAGALGMWTGRLLGF